MKYLITMLMMLVLIPLTSVEAGLINKKELLTKEVKTKVKKEVKKKEVIVYITVTGRFNHNMEANIIPEILKAPKGSTIVLRIQSPGGYVRSLGNIGKALVQHEGKLVAVIHGYAYSAAAMLMLISDEIIFINGSDVMFHAPYVRARTGAHIQFLIHTTKGATHQYAKAFFKMAKHGKCLMTESQWKDFNNGEDIYIYYPILISITMPGCKSNLVTFKQLPYLLKSNLIDRVDEVML